MQFKKLLRVLIPFCVLVLSATFVTATIAQPSFHFGNSKRFEFALIGDLPYDARQEELFQDLIKDINQSQSRFVIHDGDFKSGSSLCSDQLFLQRKQLLEQFKSPLIFIFGDNEWTDCHRPAAGGYDPIERLAKLRELLTQGDQSLGKKTITLTRQSDNSLYSKFRENVRWTAGNVLFVGVHVVGSNNNLGRNAENDAEYAERNAANLAWLREAFNTAKAKNNLGMVIVIHANPNFELPVNDPDRTGFNDFISLLQTEMQAYSKPVIFVHGDSHYFQIDKPLNHTQDGTAITNFTRVESFGSPNVHWLKVVVDPKNPNLFEITQEIIQ